MKLKTRLLFLSITVIFTVSYYYKKNVTFTGSVAEVEGWSKNTSKEVGSYISESLKPHIMPTNFCEQKGILLVMVNVRPGNFEAREVIRETWGQKRDNVSFYFLMGEDKSRNYELELRLKEEGAKFDDLIQERFIDSYNNLTLKSINMLKLFSLHCANSYKFLMKIDDDVFLNVENVLEMLRNGNISSNLLVGKIINNTKPFRDPTNKWFVPYELYLEEKYPDYLCGATYLMSRDVAEKLYRCALETRIFYIEDVYVTGICAKKINVTPQHHDLFTCQMKKKYICLHRDLFTLHYFKPEEIKKSYQMIEGERCPGPGSWTEWFNSFFY